MTEVIFQDVIVKTDLFTINYQVKVPRRMQNLVYLVVDQVVVASFNAASFPDNYKEALLHCFRLVDNSNSKNMPI